MCFLIVFYLSFIEKRSELGLSEWLHLYITFFSKQPCFSRCDIQNRIVYFNSIELLYKYHFHSHTESIEQLNLQTEFQGHIHSGLSIVFVGAEFKFAQIPSFHEQVIQSSHILVPFTPRP